MRRILVTAIPLLVASACVAGFLQAMVPPPPAAAPSNDSSAGTAPAATSPAVGGGRGRRGGGGAGGGGGRGGFPPGPQGPEPRVHDPVMMKEGDWYYLFYTGGNLGVLRSKDFKGWEPVLRKVNDRDVFTVFTQPPAWTAETIPGSRGFWAPDISYFNGKYHLYYSVSTFGRNRSAIGLATTKALDPASPDYKWEDQGLVVQSENASPYNCIDANVLVDKDGTPWLTFGSFWWSQRARNIPDAETALRGGMQLVKLDAATGKPAKDAPLIPIASRAAPSRAIEAPFLIRRGDWYYLFVSWDRCCAGLDSTYRIMVGRSQKVTGPYIDREGKEMVAGGGTQVLAGDKDRIIGPGHQAVVEDGVPGTPSHRWLLVYHFYDGHTPNGVSKLGIRPLTFDEAGWPVAGAALNSPAPPLTRPAGQAGAAAGR